MDSEQSDTRREIDVGNVRQVGAAKSAGREECIRYIIVKFIEDNTPKLILYFTFDII